MSSQYPSILTAYTDPQSSDRLSSPSHSGVEQNQNSGLRALETFVGTLSSTAGTLMYDIRAAASGGGGHVQSVNKGGTGQTSYNKGDLLIATSSSVLAKLAVSSVTGDVLTADPAQSSGVNWTHVVANKVAVGTNVTTIASTSVSGVLFATSIIGSTLGTNNAVRFRGYLSNFSISNDTLTLTVNYGNNSILSFNTGNNGPVLLNSKGFIDVVVVGHTSVATQKAFGEMFSALPGVGSSINAAVTTAYGTSSVNSSTDQNLVVNAKWADVRGSIVGQFFTIEKIV